MQKTATPQNEASGQNPRKSYQYAHLQAHAWNGKEKRQISHPQTNLWKSDSASPRRREERAEEGDLPLERSKHVCRSHHQTTDCDARESGRLPDAADHQTRQEQQREQQAKTPAPAGVTVAAHKVAAPAAAEAGHAIPHDAAAEAVTPAKTPDAPREEEPDKLMTNLASSWKKTDGRAAMDAPPEQEGRPPLHQATGG